jgi:hypothetical protein
VAPALGGWGLGVTGAWRPGIRGDSFAGLPVRQTNRLQHLRDIAFGRSFVQLNVTCAHSIASTLTFPIASCRRTLRSSVCTGTFKVRIGTPGGGGMKRLLTDRFCTGAKPRDGEIQTDYFDTQVSGLA